MKHGCVNETSQMCLSRLVGKDHSLLRFFFFFETKNKATLIEASYVLSCIQLLCGRAAGTVGGPVKCLFAEPELTC